MGVEPPIPLGTLLQNVFLKGNRVYNTALIATSYTLVRFWPKGRKKNAI